MKNCIGVLKERLYRNEKRVPLTPDHVARLVREGGLRVVVEPSEKRCFPEGEYLAAGATLSGDLSDCNIVFGVKEIPAPDVLPGKAHLIFSHTTGGHPSNMPMLRQVIEGHGTLLDYELIKSERGKRLVFFGRFAGYAGMIDALNAMGQRLSWEGIESPFREILPAHAYPSLADAEAEIRRIGANIRRDGLPPLLTPFVCGFTGRGNVAQGAMRIFRQLPMVSIPPERLLEFFRRGQFSNGTLYCVHFRQRDLFEPRDRNLEFDWSRLHRHPEDYVNRFEGFVPYLSMLVNGVYWETRFPRLITKSYLRSHYERNPNPRLRVVADITCDVEGSIEATVKTTDSGEGSLYVYEPLRDEAKDGVGGLGPVMLAIDTLPSELPREASVSFGDALMPFVCDLAGADFGVGHEEDLALPAEVKKAVIVHNGRLTRRYEYLEDSMSRAS